jgi:hypothetical protein
MADGAASVRRRRLWKWAAGAAVGGVVLRPGEAQAAGSRLDASVSRLVRTGRTRTRSAVLRLAQSRVDVLRAALPRLLGDEAGTATSPMRLELDKVYVGSALGPLTTAAVEVFFASQFGAIGDGIADDTNALRALAAAAVQSTQQHGPGSARAVLDIPHATYRITDQVTFSSFSGLSGTGSVGLNATTHPASTIKLDSPTACVVFGNATLDANHRGHTMFAVSGGDFDIDGNHTGAPEGALRIDGVNQINLSNVGVVNAGGTGWRVAQTQNSTFENVAVHDSGRAGYGDGLHLSGGAGGILFSRCYVNGVSAMGHELHITKDAGIYDVYGNGPSHNTFHHCIFETGQSTDSLLRVTDGGVNLFDSCLFAGPAAPVVLGSGALTDIAGAPWLEFRTCRFVGNGNAMRIRQNAFVKVTGFSVFQTSAALFKIDNCAPTVDFDQTRAYVINQPLTDLVGPSASEVRFGRDTNVSTRYRFPATPADPNASQIAPWSIVEEGDAQARWLLSRDGTMRWGPGGTATPTQSLGRDPGYGVRVGGGLRVDGRVATGHPGWVFGGDTNTYTLDTATSKYFRYAFTAGGSPRFVFANPLDGTEVAVQVSVGSGAVTATWSDDVWFRNGTPPALAVHTFTTVHLRHDAALGNGGAWVETGRSVATNNATVTEEAFPSGVRVSKRLVTAQPGYVYGGGADTMTVDAATSTYFRFGFTAGGTPGFVIDHPVDGQEIAIQVYVGATPLGATTWPATVRFALGQTPSFPANSLTTLRLRYDAALDNGAGAWVETGRQVAANSEAPVAAPVSWTAPNLAAGVSNVGAGYEPAGYCRTPQGEVVLRGLVQNLTVGATIFTLPNGHRPSGTARFPVWTSDGGTGALGCLDVTADGRVVLAAGATSQLALRGVGFPAEQ